MTKNVSGFVFVSANIQHAKLLHVKLSQALVTAVPIFFREKNNLPLTAV